MVQAHAGIEKLGNLVIEEFETVRSGFDFKLPNFQITQFKIVDLLNDFSRNALCWIIGFGRNGYQPQSAITVIAHGMRSTRRYQHEHGAGAIELAVLGF
jgi:hypothetical protein